MYCRLYFFATTPAIIFRRCHWNTCNKISLSVTSNRIFQKHLNKIWKKLSKSFFHLLTVLLTPVIKLYFWISQRIFVNSEMAPGPRETDSLKKTSCHTPFKCFYLQSLSRHHYPPVKKGRRTFWHPTFKVQLIAAFIHKHYRLSQNSPPLSSKYWTSSLLSLDTSPLQLRLFAASNKYD